MTIPNIRRSLVRIMGMLAAVAVLCTPTPTQAQENVLDEIVAVVGDQIILKSEIDGLVAGIVQQQRATYSDELWADALNQVVDQKVMAVHAQRDTTIIVTDDQIDQTLNDRIEQLTQQVGSTDRIEEIYGKSLVQIRADLRSDFRERLLAEQFQTRKLRTIKVTPSEIETWFSQFPTDSLPTLPDIVRVSHLVRHPKVSQQAEDEALEIITTIRDSVAAGTSALEDMARRFSEDTGSASEGGRYQEMNLGDLVPEFAAVASRSEIGALSAPFRSEFGYHILRVNDRRGEVVDFTHVLIRIDDSQADPTEAIAFLSTLRDSIVTRGAAFEILARRHSEEEISSEIGGRLIDPSTGERDLFLEALGEEWKQTVDTLDIGEISHPAPVELLDGSRAYHIVKLQHHVPSHRVDIETDYSRIEQLALQEKRARVMRTWLDGLREDVYFEFRGKGEAAMSHASARPDTISQRRN